MKKIININIFFSLLIFLFIFYAQKLDKNKVLINNDISGTYILNRDSINNSNIQFYEKIEILETGKFIYYLRKGGFIKIKIEGDWEIEEKYLILNSHNKKREYDLEKKICSNAQMNYYILDIMDLNGKEFDYNLKINSKKIIRNLRGQTILSEDKIINIQVITSSGLYSPLISLIEGTKCYNLFVNNKKQFYEEKWIIENNKIKPLRFDRTSANYYLYKIK